MQPAELLSLRSSIEECSILRSPLFTVGEYQAHQLLGSGAFGNVYKVRTQGLSINWGMGGRGKGGQGVGGREQGVGGGGGGGGQGAGGGGQAGGGRGYIPSQS